MMLCQRATNKIRRLSSFLTKIIFDKTKNRIFKTKLENEAHTEKTILIWFFSLFFWYFAFTHYVHIIYMVVSFVFFLLPFLLFDFHLVHKNEQRWKRSFIFRRLRAYYKTFTIGFFFWYFISFDFLLLLVSWFFWDIVGCFFLLCFCISSWTKDNGLVSSNRTNAKK